MKSSVVLGGVAVVVTIGGLAVRLAEPDGGAQPDASTRSVTPSGLFVTVDSAGGPALCRSPAVVVFRDLWPSSGDSDLTDPTRVADRWTRPHETAWLRTAPDAARTWIVVGHRLDRPRVLLDTVQFHGRWYLKRTFGCSDLWTTARGRCWSRVRFRGASYEPAPDLVERSQVGVGRVFGQASASGCFARGDGSWAVLRGPAWPVTAYQEEEASFHHSVVVSMLRPGMRTFVALSASGAGADVSAHAGAAQEVEPPRR